MVVNRLTQNEQVVWLLLLCTLIFFPGQDAEARKTAAGTLAKQDRDGDGKISRQEWRKKRIFHSVDLNGDGYVSLEELEIRFGEKSADGDGNAERPDRKTISAIRRAGFDDVQDLKNLGLFETGLHPTWSN
ncbi:MAG: EF-hand domain-containing protein, partial [Gammaproteobacteria bacterium]|nr:EF-hand domain-containing protein [Gammaproteobacteria bacterium]